MIKGERGLPLDHADDADMTVRLLRASRDGAIECWTSMMAIAEVLRVGEGPPDVQVQLRIQNLLLSGRDGVFVHGISPSVVIKARDLYWVDGLKERAADRLHVATALDLGCVEILSVDGRLARKFDRTKIASCALRSARETRNLPDEYRQDSLV
jgi:predicted nucleic acid-binding protein